VAARADFTEEEWERLGRAPLLAGMAITLADPGGPIETIKESSAALRTVVDAAREGGYGDFVQSVAQDAAARAARRESPLAGFRPDRRHMLDDILDELRGVATLLRLRGTPQDVADFREWLRVASQRAALAAREGGFLGIGGQRVSEREQEMLETLGEIFGVPRGGQASSEPQR
jgi:hypothetical protein